MVRLPFDRTGCRLFLASKGLLQLLYFFHSIYHLLPRATFTKTTYIASRAQSPSDWLQRPNLNKMEYNIIPYYNMLIVESSNLSSLDII